jgi:hypothetical protein
LGDLAIVTLDGRAELCARRGAVMAYSGKIKTKLTTRGFGLVSEGVVCVFIVTTDGFEY